MKTDLTVYEAGWELDRIANAGCMSDRAREAAKRANELMRAVRAAIDLDWDSPAKALHEVGLSVKARDYLPELRLLVAAVEKYAPTPEDWPELAVARAAIKESGA